MVWCARESGDYRQSAAMVSHWHYGWIHWDAVSKTWHSVTSYQLGPPDSSPAFSTEIPLGLVGPSVRGAPDT